MTIRLAALKTAPHAFGAVHDVEAAKPLAEHAARLASSIVLGAYDGARIVGMAGFRAEAGPQDAHKGLVWGVYVEPQCRGQGVGTALISALVATARGAVEQLKLTVVAGNHPAVSIYERFGFVTYGVEPRALKTQAGYADECLMVLFL